MDCFCPHYIFVYLPLEVVIKPVLGVLSDWQHFIEQNLVLPNVNAKEFQAVVLQYQIFEVEPLKDRHRVLLILPRVYDYM